MARTTISTLLTKKKEEQKITVLTAYDYYMGKLVDEAGIDVILVGDSLGMVIQGQEDTLGVTIEEMIYHSKMVKRGTKRALIVTDMPFMSFQIGVKEALTQAGRIIKESGVGAVKLEGGKRVTPQVKALVEAGIPVMGHLGLTPQSVNQLSGYKVQGQDKQKAQELIADALALQEAGVFSIVLETVPLELAQLITAKLKIPTIGIGAGPYCDGQVLVLHDLLGFDQDFKPKFVRPYTNLNQIIKKAVSNYIADIKQGCFPAESESYHMSKEQYQGLSKGDNCGDNN